MATRIPILFEIITLRKITHKQLGDNIGVSTGNISDWKSGRSAPGIEVLSKIADYLDCSVDYLLGRTDNQKSRKNTSEDNLFPDEQRILSAYRNFNDEGKEKLLDIVSDMTQLDRYKKQPIYRAATSQDHTEHEIIPDGKSTIEKLSKIPPVTKKEDF